MISLERVANRGKEVAGIEYAIADELERISMKFIGAGLRHNVYRPGTVLAVLSGQRTGFDFELLQRIRERKRQA